MMETIKLLYIEDEAQQRKLVKEQLISAGLKVTAATSGITGLKRFKKGVFDVVLCDLNMPEMDGLKVLKSIRRIDKAIPVIILTAHGSVKMAVKALKQGADDFVLKPIEINKITTTIQKALEKKNLDQRLAKSESDLQILMENVPDLVYSLNTRGEFVNLSPSVDRLLGYKISDLMGKSVFDLVHPEDKQTVKAGFKNAMEKGDVPVNRVEFRMLSQKGETKYFEVNRRLVFENGKVIRQDGIGRDITQRKQLEEKLKKYSEELEKRVEERTASLEYANRQLRKLNEVSNTLSLIYSEADLFEEAPRLLCSSLDFDRGILLLDQAGRLELVSYCMAKDSPELVKNFLARVKEKNYKIPPHFHESFEKNKTIFIPDLNSDRRWPRDPGQVIRTKAVVITPIKADKKPIGLIMGNMQHHDREMNDQDIARFEMFANMIGFALDNIRAYQTLEAKVIERTKELKSANQKLRQKAKEAEKQTYSLAKANVDLLAVQEQLEKKNAEITESEEKFRQLTENIHEAFWIVDLNLHRTIYVSPAYEAIFGRPAKLLYQNSQDWLEVVHPEDKDRVASAITQNGAEENEQEFRILHANQSVRWIRSRAFPVRDQQGQIYRICGVSRDITERKQAREALEKERNFVSTILDTAGALVVVLDTQGRIIRFNRACEQTTGYSFDEVMGKYIWDILLIADEIARVRVLFEKLVAGDFPNQIENYWLTKEGGRRLIAWSNTALVDKDGNIEFVISTGIDITERYEAQKALQESEERFRSIAQSANDAIISADSQGKIISWSKGAEKIFGYKEDEVIGKSLTKIMPEKHRAAHKKGFKRAISSGKSRIIGKVVEFEGLRKGGMSFPMELSLATWKAGEDKFFGGVIRDISERKEAETALRKSLDDLAQANEHLKDTQTQLVQSEKMAALGMLVAGIAHEINTPIGAVTSMHDTLKRAVNKLRQTLAEHFPDALQNNPSLSRPLKIIEEANRVIDSGSDRVTTIIRRLRSFARLDEADLKTVDIHEGLEDTLTLIHHEIKHHIKITKNFGDIPPIACFPGRLNQVYLNLLINSKQAIREKGEVIITTKQVNDKVQIIFEDNGVGIPKEKLKKIFDPGFTTKGVGVGTGLGLSIVYQIIVDHKGSINVESEEDKGTKFTITLPMNLDDLLEKTEFSLDK